MCLFPTKTTNLSTKTLNCWVSQHWRDKVKYIKMATYLYFLLTLVSVTPVREKRETSVLVLHHHKSEHHTQLKRVLVQSVVAVIQSVVLV